MNKIVKEHYPASRLPEDLRKELQGDAWVRIEIVPEAEGQMSLRLADLVGTGRNVHGGPDDVLTHIRDLRDDR